MSAGLAMGGVAAAFSLAGCGLVGSGSADDVQGAAPSTSTAVQPTAPAATAATDTATITELARTVILADQVGDICREKLSAKFVATVYRTVARCEKTWVDPDDKDTADDPTGVSVSDARVNGDVATAVITLQGGEVEGVSGTWAFLRAEETWRVAAWGIDFLRSSFSFDSYRSDGPEDPLGYPAVKNCLSDKLERRSDAAFRTFAYGLARQNRNTIGRLQADVMTCARVPDADGVTTLRRLFEVGVRQGMKSTTPGSEAVYDCVVQRLRKTLSDDDVADGTLAWQKTGVYPREMLQRAYRAGFDCAAAAPTAPATKLA